MDTGPAKCSSSLFMQIVGESTDNLFIFIYLYETRLEIFYPYQGKDSWVIKDLGLVNVALHCL